MTNHAAARRRMRSWKTWTVAGLALATALLLNVGQEPVAAASGPIRLTDSMPGAASGLWNNGASTTPVALNGHLLFEASDPAHGVELWTSDGTIAGTHRLKDIRPGPNGSYPDSLRVVSSRAFFWATDGTHGEGLWVTDGTRDGTTLVRAMNGGAGVDFRGVYIFPGGNGLWRSDGTPTGTVRLAGNVVPRFEFGTAAFSQWLLFSACDGTGEAAHCAFYRTTAAPGTMTLVKDVEPDLLLFPTANAPQMATLDGVAYFAANDGAHGVELWRSDGTPHGTRMVKDIVAGARGSDAGLLGGFAAAGQYVFFDAGDNRDNFWRTDGTSSGTRMVKDINPGGSSDPKGLTALGNVLVFSAGDDVNGVELWRSDGTKPGTTMVKNIAGFASSSVNWTDPSQFPRYRTAWPSSRQPT